MDVTQERPRHVDNIGPDFLTARNHIIRLLRQPGAEDH